MAKNYKRRRTAGSGMKTPQLGDLGIGSTRRQSEIITQGLELARRQYAETHEEHFDSLKGVDKNEEENQRILKDLYDQQWVAKRSAIETRRDTEVSALRGKAAEAERWAKYWQDLTPTVSNAFAQLATKLYDKEQEQKANKIFNENDVYTKMADEQDKLAKAIADGPLAKEEQKLLDVIFNKSDKYSPDDKQDAQNDLVRIREQQAQARGYTFQDGPRKYLPELHKASLVRNLPKILENIELRMMEKGIARTAENYQKYADMEVLSLMRMSGLHKNAKYVTQVKKHAHDIISAKYKSIKTKRTTDLEKGVYQAYRETANVTKNKNDVLALYKATIGTGETKLNRKEAFDTVLQSTMEDGWSAEEIDENVWELPVLDKEGNETAQLMKEKFPDDYTKWQAEIARKKKITNDLELTTLQKADLANVEVVKGSFHRGELTFNALQTAYKTADLNNWSQSADWLSKQIKNSGSAYDYRVDQLTKRVETALKQDNVTEAMYILESSGLQPKENAEIFETVTNYQTLLNKDNFSRDFISTQIKDTLKTLLNVQNIDNVIDPSINEAIYTARALVYSRGVELGSIRQGLESVKADIVSNKGLWEIERSEGQYENYSVFKNFSPRHTPDTAENNVDNIRKLLTSNKTGEAYNTALSDREIGTIARNVAQGTLNVDFPDIIESMSQFTGELPHDIVNKILINKGFTERVNASAGVLGMTKYNIWRQKAITPEIPMPTDQIVKNIQPLKVAEQFQIAVKHPLEISMYTDVLDVTKEVPMEFHVKAQAVDWSEDPVVAFNNAFPNATPEDMIMGGWHYGINYIPGYGFLSEEQITNISTEQLNERDRIKTENKKIRKTNEQQIKKRQNTGNPKWF